MTVPIYRSVPSSSEIEIYFWIKLEKSIINFNLNQSTNIAQKHVPNLKYLIEKITLEKTRASDNENKGNEYSPDNK